MIPAKLQQKATQLGHVGHQGIKKTKSLLRKKIWYPNKDKRVQEMIDKCIACQTVGHGNPLQPMEITPTADTPWTSVAIDFYGREPQTGEYLLVVTDTYSKFPEVEIVNSTEARVCIPKLDKIFATHGIPNKIKTDNGPPFNSHDYERYMQVLGIEWQTSTPLWPQGNAKAESFMKPLGKMTKTATIEGKNWRQELQRFLLSYRSTPHATTKIAPPVSYCSTDRLKDIYQNWRERRSSTNTNLQRRTLKLKSKTTNCTTTRNTESRSRTSKKETLLFAYNQRRTNLHQDSILNSSL